MADFSVNILLKAQDEASPVMRRLVANASGLGSRLERAAGRGGRRGGGQGQGAGDEFGRTMGAADQRASQGLALADSIGSGLVAAGASVNQITSSAKSVLAPIISEGVDFERTMAEVLAFGGSKFEPYMDQLNEQARQLGRDTEFTAIQAAQAQKQLGQAGLEPTDVIKAMPDVLNMAKAGALDLGKAAEISSATLNQFGMESSRVGEVVDLLAVTASSSQTNIGQLGNALLFVGGTANNMGISLADTNVLLGGLGKTALNSGKAGRNLNAMLIGMADLHRPTMKSALKATQVDIAALTSELDSGQILPAIKRLRKGFEDVGITGREQVAILSRVFGRQGGRAMTNLIAADAKGQLDELAEGTKNAAGEGQRMADVMGNTTRGKIRLAESAFSDLKLTIADELLPAMQPLLVDAVELSKATAAWVTENRELIATYGPILLKLVAVGTVLGPLLSTMGNSIKLLTGMGRGLHAVGVGMEMLGTKAGVSAGKLGVLKAAGGGLTVAIAGSAMIIGYAAAKIANLRAESEALGRDVVSAENRLAKSSSTEDLDAREASLIAALERENKKVRHRVDNQGFSGKFLSNFSDEFEIQTTARDTIAQQLEDVQTEKTKRNHIAQEQKEATALAGLLESVQIVNRGIEGKDAAKARTDVDKLLSESKIQVGLNIRVDQDGRVTGAEQVGDGIAGGITTGLLTGGM